MPLLKKKKTRIKKTRQVHENYAFIVGDKHFHKDTQKIWSNPENPIQVRFMESEAQQRNKMLRH